MTNKEKRMERQLRGLAVRTSGRTATFLASTDALARDGMIIEKDAWQLENFSKNPAILWSHRYDEPPIGRATSVKQTDAGLVMDVEFDEQDPFAAEIARKVRDGFLNAISVGFQILKQIGNRVTSVELYEASIVPVPSDPNALAMARSAYNRTATVTGDLLPRLRAIGQDDAAALERLHAVLCPPAQMRQIQQERFERLVRTAFVAEAERRRQP
jgi:HK97 family phage prohead protease